MIVALDQYRHDYGYYPVRQEVLIPKYLPNAGVFRFRYHGKQFDLRYHRETGDSYDLSFGYMSGFPSAMNDCWYHSKTGQWHCHGYY